MADSGAKRASLEFFQYLINSPESCVDDKVCVVGIFGKDSVGYKSKAVHLNGTIGKEVFKIDFLDSMFKNKDRHEFSCDIDVYHDVEQRIIYLHLVSVYDISRLLQLCKQAPQEVENAESHQYWMSHEFYYACALMFLFSVSHIIVVLHPSQTFDLNYIRLFRTLASTRHQLLPQISQLLSGVEGIPDIWRQTGRPCIPRLVCSLRQRVPFVDPSQISGKNQDTYASKTKGKQQTITPQKKLQHAVEDQLYSIMRKARLLGSLSSSSLFTVNSSHAFVHVQPCSRAFDPVSILLNTLAKPAINTKWVESSPLLKKSKFLKREILQPGGDVEALGSAEEVLFKDYLKQQIDHLMTGDAGRDGVAEGRRGTHVEVPSCRLWARVSLALFEFFLTPKSDLIAPLAAMASHLDLDMKFSEARCRKAIPVATSAYLENLPSHYTQNVHLNQLSQALRVFSLHARGPAFEHYAAQFQDECNKVWMNGRQLCEERSLTGRHCVYPYHRVPRDGEVPSDPGSDDSKEVGITPCKPHSSRITSMSACNCGRIQEHREDPFDLKTANFDFFNMLELKCCSSLVHLLFPFHPILSSVREENQDPKKMEEEAPLLEMSLELGVLSEEETKSGGGGDEDHRGHEPSNSVSLVSPVATTTASILIPNVGSVGGVEAVGSMGYSASSTYGASGYQSTLDMMSHEGPEFRSVTSELKSGVSVGMPSEISTAGSQDAFHTAGTNHTQRLSSAEKFTRQRSEKEQVLLETMLTTDSPSGIFPRFPSWSLCRLGSSNGYSPSKGLELPGFFPNSNFLLAWDIPLLNDSQSDLPSQFDGQGKHLGPKQMTEEAWPTLNELPSAGSSISSLPLHQALSYARRQCADYKGNMPPVVSTSGSGKGPSGASRQRGRASRDGSLPTVRAYIGLEYECPRGHRFICSGPDKMVKATSSGHVKETAHKLVTSDMPLYFPCPCRSSKPLMAQMMRVFVVTPDSPILVTLNPRVQPSVPPCPVFYPGVAAGFSLPPSSFCVLRLPYVYVSEGGPILPPGDSQPLLSCRVLKGMFSAMGHSQDITRRYAMPGKR